MNAIDLVRSHEGLRLMPYRDTRGYLTIGFGRCLEKKGISFNEAEMLLQNDIDDVRRHLGEHIWFRNAPTSVCNVIIDMAFNLGVEGVLEFRDMIAAIERRDWKGAAVAMLASKWAQQVGDRATEDASIIGSLEIP